MPIFGKIKSNSINTAEALKFLSENKSILAEYVVDFVVSSENADEAKEKIEDFFEKLDIYINIEKK